MTDPGGEIQMAVMGVLKDHAKTAEGVRAALTHDYPGRFSYNDILLCMLYLEKHDRIVGERRGGLYYFIKR